MERIFLDANILFSAAYRPNAGLQKLWELPNTEIATSTYAIEEAKANLQHEGQLKLLDTLLKNVVVISSWEHITLPENVELVEKDVPILQAAIAGEADYLITGDIRDFGDYFGKTISGVEVIRPADYMRLK